MTASYNVYTQSFSFFHFNFYRKNCRTTFILWKKKNNSTLVPLLVKGSSKNACHKQTSNETAAASKWHHQNVTTSYDPQFFKELDKFRKITNRKYSPRNSSEHPSDGTLSPPNSISRDKTRGASGDGINPSGLATHKKLVTCLYRSTAAGGAGAVRVSHLPRASKVAAAQPILIQR